MPANDAPQSVTDLDVEREDQLLDYLRRRGHIGHEEIPSVTVLGGGVSNRTVLVERADGESWVLKQALGKLRVQVDWFADPARIHREALGIRWLSELAPPNTIPQLVFEDQARHLLAMTAVPSPHENWKHRLLRGDVDLAHVEQFARLLGQIHGRAYERRDAVRPVFDDRGYFESLRLEPYYGYAAAQAPEAGPFLRRLIAGTRQRPLTLVHGDYSPKNILIHADRLILLDHEVIHWGDPAFDVGFASTHLLSKAHHLPAHREAFADAARRCWAIYRASIGDAPWAEALETWAGRHTLGCLMARVAGRSPLEYFTDQTKRRQRAVVARLMGAPPMAFDALIQAFINEL
ncbi:MAG: phosphotransferase [Phycisphaeraceae bacterium]